VSEAVEIAFACPRCGTRAVEGPLRLDTTALACAEGHVTPLPEAADALAGERFGPCPVCGGSDLYQQRDFNRRLGLALAAVGLALGPFTAWISTIVAIGLDALLYLVTPVVCVCYACNAQFRGVPEGQRPEGFEIAIHDAYKFGKRFPPRRDLAVAGPHQMRLRAEQGG
jgi:hypothetical protein